MFGKTTFTNFVFISKLRVILTCMEINRAICVFWFVFSCPRLICSRLYKVHLDTTRKRRGARPKQGARLVSQFSPVTQVQEVLGIKGTEAERTLRVDGAMISHMEIEASR